MIGPTAIQRSVLRYVHNSLVTRGIAPSMREILHQFGWASTNAANDHLRALERRGLITREAMHSRAITVTDKGREALGLISGVHDRCAVCGRTG